MLSLLLHLLPSIAVFVRRLHDTNRSGWLYLLILTGVGIIPLLVFACQRGTLGANHYGPEDGADPTAAEPTGYFAPAASQAVAWPSADPLVELERLAALRNTGALTEGEFAHMKAQVMGSTSAPRVEPRL